jgi:hypothetical protein
MFVRPPYPPPGSSVVSYHRHKERGINPPEGCVNPMDFVELAKCSVELGKKRGLPIVVEYVDKSGRSKTIALPI